MNTYECWNAQRQRQLLASLATAGQQTPIIVVERKQIPHLRVMGRNIRFLKSELETFRASFKQEMENG